MSETDVQDIVQTVENEKEKKRKKRQERYSKKAEDIIKEIDEHRNTSSNKVRDLYNELVENCKFTPGSAKRAIFDEINWISRSTIYRALPPEAKDDTRGKQSDLENLNVSRDTHNNDTDTSTVADEYPTEEYQPSQDTQALNELMNQASGPTTVIPEAVHEAIQEDIEKEHLKAEIASLRNELAQKAIEESQPAEPVQTVDEEKEQMAMTIQQLRAQIDGTPTGRFGKARVILQPHDKKYEGLEIGIRMINEKKLRALIVDIDDGRIVNLRGIVPEELKGIVRNDNES